MKNIENLFYRCRNSVYKAGTIEALQSLDSISVYNSFIIELYSNAKLILRKLLILILIRNHFYLILLLFLIPRKRKMKKRK